MSQQLALFPEATTIVNRGSYWEALDGPRLLCFVYRYPDGFGISTVPHEQRRFVELAAAADFAAGLRERKGAA